MKIDYSKRKREGPGRSTVRNTEGRSFRELMREARLERALKRLKGYTDRALAAHEKYLRQARDTAPDVYLTTQQFIAIRSGALLEQNFKRLLPLIAGSTGDIDALWDVMHYAFILGGISGPLEFQTERARNFRVRPWHGEALTMAPKMRGYPKELTAVAKRIHDKLKDRPGVAPPSWDAVRQVLKRDLAKKRKSRQDD